MTQTLLPGHTLTLSFTHTPPAAPWTNHICRLQSGAGSLMCIEQNSRCALYNHWRGKGKEESKRITVKTFPCFLLSACVSLLSCLPCQTGSVSVALLLYLLRLFLPYTPRPFSFCSVPLLASLFFSQSGEALLFERGNEMSQTENVGHLLFLLLLPSHQHRRGDGTW